MTEVLLLIGLPGSGKTTLAQTIYVPEGYVLVDDPVNISVVSDAIRAHTKVVVTDPRLTDPSAREAALKWFAQARCKVQCLYYENDPIKAAVNLKNRDDSRGPINLRAMSKFYIIPAGVAVLPIYHGLRPT